MRCAIYQMRRISIFVVHLYRPDLTAENRFRKLCSSPWLNKGENWKSITNARLQKLSSVEEQNVAEICLMAYVYTHVMAQTCQLQKIKKIQQNLNGHRLPNPGPFVCQSNAFINLSICPLPVFVHADHFRILSLALPIYSLQSRLWTLGFKGLRKIEKFLKIAI